MQPDPYKHQRRLIETLSTLPPAEILDFDYWWVQARNQAYTARLWAAVTLINRRWVSDDSFEYFIGWLILRGRNTFKTVVDDPDALAEIVSKDDPRELSFEGYPAHDAWMEATGSPREAGGWEAFAAAAESRHGEYFGLPDLDEDVSFLEDEDELRSRLPRLASVYPDQRPARGR